MKVFFVIWKFIWFERIYWFKGINLKDILIWFIEFWKIFRSEIFFRYESFADSKDLPIENISGCEVYFEFETLFGSSWMRWKFFSCKSFLVQIFFLTWKFWFRNTFKSEKDRRHKKKTERWEGRVDNNVLSAIFSLA